MRLNELMKPFKDFEKENPDDFWNETHGGQKAYNSPTREIMNFIDKHCKKAVTAMQDTQTFLYRRIGYDVGAPNIFHGITPTARESYSAGYDQLLLDKILQQCGFSSLRSNSICCTGSNTDLYGFGKLYHIFPVKGFDFTWSPKIEDIGANNEFASSMAREKLVSSPKKFVKYWQFSKNNFAMALHSKNEITIHGQYIALADKYHTELVKRFGIGI